MVCSSVYLLFALFCKFDKLGGDKPFWKHIDLVMDRKVDYLRSENITSFEFDFNMFQIDPKSEF